jgi:hypothetical protein
MRIVKITFRVFTCVCLLVISTSTFAQDKARIMEWHSPDKGFNGLISPGMNQKFSPSEIKALEVVAVTLEGKPVPIGQEFLADDDWISKLTFRLKNTSQIPIHSISLGFSLPETKDGENRVGFSFVYGKEFRRGSQNQRKEAILPGEEVDLKLSEIEYQSFKESLARRGLISNFKSITIGNVMAYFDDGTLWLGLSLPVTEKNL